MDFLEELEEERDVVGLNQQLNEPWMVGRKHSLELELLGEQSFGRLVGVIDGVRIDLVAELHHSVAHPEGETKWIDESVRMGMRIKAGVQYCVEPLDHSNIVALIVLDDLKEEDIVFEHESQTILAYAVQTVREQLILRV